MKNKFLLKASIILFFTLYLLPFTFSDVPHLIQYQGKATDKTSVLPLSGNHNITLRIYDSPTTTTILWEEQHLSVPLTNGNFSLQMGSQNALDLPFDKSYWLGLEIDNDGEMLPRERLVSVPYAYYAEKTKSFSIPSIFKVFCGDGSDGNINVESDINFSTLTNSIDDWRLQTKNLSIKNDATVTVDTGWAFIGVQGTCTIHGSINANGKGELGGALAPGEYGFCGSSAEGFGGGTSYHGEGGPVYNGVIYLDYAQNDGESPISTQFPVLACVSGGGGGGSGANVSSCGGGSGGGAGGPGGTGGHLNIGKNATSTPVNKMKALTGGGLGDNSSHGYSHLLPFIVQFRGAGGGSGSNSSSTGKGGNGGGVIYIECNSLVFDGIITANGEDGENGAENEGAGGGGGGGIVLIRARQLITNNGFVSVTGGSGGTAGSAGSWAGGNGADGFKDIIEVE